MSYEIKRLVCDYNDTHIVVQSTQQLEIIPKTLMFFKVSVKDKQSQGKISFQHTRKTDLTVFYDTKVKEPCDRVHSKMYTNPKCFLLSFQTGYECYTTDYVYFSLYSLSGSFTVMQLTFQD